MKNLFLSVRISKDPYPTIRFPLNSVRPVRTHSTRHNHTPRHRSGVGFGTYRVHRAGHWTAACRFRRATYGRTQALAACSAGWQPVAAVAHAMRHALLLHVAWCCRPDGTVSTTSAGKDAGASARSRHRAPRGLNSHGSAARRTQTEGAELAERRTIARRTTPGRWAGPSAGAVTATGSQPQAHPVLCHRYRRWASFFRSLCLQSGHRFCTAIACWMHCGD